MSAIEYIDVSDDEMEMSPSEHSEQSEGTEDEHKRIMAYIENACKFMSKKELIELGHLAMKELAEFDGETRKVKAPRSQGSLKHQAWIDWVLRHCQTEGWAEFETVNKKTGVTKTYAGAGMIEDKIVFCDTGKPFNRSHAIAYASLYRETSLYSEFESTYSPDSVAVSAVDDKKTERERKAAEKEAEREAKKAAAAEKKLIAQREKDEKARIKLAEKAAKEAEKAAKEAAKAAALAAIKPVHVAAPPALVKIAAPVKAAPAAAVKPTVSVVAAPAPPPLLKKKVAMWEKPAKGITAWRTIDGVKYVCDHYDNLFTIDESGEQYFMGRVDPVTGKCDATAEEIEEN